jgi:hypothetical protein
MASGVVSRNARACLKEVAHHAVDLLDHRRGEDLDLDADLDVGRRPRRHLEARVALRIDGEDAVAEGAVAACPSRGCAC